MKFLKKVIPIVLVVSFILTSVSSEAAVKTIKTITIGNYIKMLEDAIGQKQTKDEDYLDKALNIGLIKEADKFNYNKNITRADTAVLTIRADEIKNGKTYDKNIYAHVKNKKRISDLNKVDINKVAAIRKCYVKGLMVGYSNGTYTTNRAFKGSSNLTNDEADTIIKRLQKKSARVKISPDGQVIRTTKLPKNYKDYDYILESLPNKFYEYKFDYQLGTYNYKPEELVNYASPKRIYLMDKKYGTTYIKDFRYYWAEKVEKNLKLRFNIDYGKIDTKWMNELNQTYVNSGDASSNKWRTDQIKQYMKKVKDNNLVVKTDKIVVEPSTLYFSGSDNYRVYVKYQVVAAKNLNVPKESIIFSKLTLLDNFKKGVWKEEIFDIEIASAGYHAPGELMGVKHSELIPLSVYE